MAKATEKQKQYMREYQKKNKEKIKERKRKHYLENSKRQTNYPSKLEKSEKKRRISARNYARKFKKKECAICQSKEDLQRHHWNYEKPYKTKFNVLCKTCHEIQHVKNFPASKFGGGI